MSNPGNHGENLQAHWDGTWGIHAEPDRRRIAELAKVHEGVKHLDEPARDEDPDLDGDARGPDAGLPLHAAFDWTAEDGAGTLARATRCKQRHAGVCSK